MHFINCLLTNPNKFIAAAYTNTDKEIISQRAQATPAYQKSRLEGTKAKAARMILSNLQLVGDDDAFYDAVKCYTTQVLVAKIFALKQKIESNPSHTKLITYTLLIIGLHLELIILTLSGHINGWGSSVGRSAGFGLFIATIFTCIYYIFNIATTLPLSVLTSLEITLLVGYTKYSTDKLPLLHQYLFALNMLLGVWWYSIFIPTVVNRINRVN